jgi:CBS domain-containing membrane protein
MRIRVTRANLADKRAFGKVSVLSSLRQRWLKRSGSPAPVVGALMIPDVPTVDATTPIADLVPLFARCGHHPIPVVDAGKRLAGMIMQADLISGLHRQACAGQRRAA